MSFSKADIFNLALAYLHITNERIDDPDDPEDQLALAFTTYWNIFVPAELEQHDWQFARGTDTLTTSSETKNPYDDLTYIYDWPSDCLTPRYIKGRSSDDHVPMRIGAAGARGAKKKLIYSARESAELVYTQDMSSDWIRFPNCFLKLLAGRLALEYGAFKLGTGKQLKGLEQLFGLLVAEARNYDASMIQDVKLQHIHTSSYLQARPTYVNRRPEAFSDPGGS